MSASAQMNKTGATRQTVSPGSLSNRFNQYDSFLNLLLNINLYGKKEQKEG